MLTIHPVTSLPNKENIKIVISEQIQRALRHDVYLHSEVLAHECIREASDRLLYSTRDEDIIGQISE